MKIITIISVIGAVLAISACGSTNTKTVTQPPPTTTAPAVDQNQTLADQMAKLDPSDLAAICDYVRLAPGAAEKMAEHILGPQIIRLGGVPSVVIPIYLAKC